MKFRYATNRTKLPVAPHVGAWIEIYGVKFRFYCVSVAPHVGAWIEIKDDVL